MVTHCCYSNIGFIGNIKNNTIEEIWNSKKINYVRDKIANGQYIEAGCEYYCRAFRLNEYYGSLKNPPEIPEGLGRIEYLKLERNIHNPQVIGIENEWACNLNCSHCLSSRSTSGVSVEYFNSIMSQLNQAKIIRFINGEYSVNKNCLEMIKIISKQQKQPTVFLVSNAQTTIEDVYPYIDKLNSLHLKVSFENIGKEYENVRQGATWQIFESNLSKLHSYFNLKSKKGKDWRLYLNLCVMKSNFFVLPEIMKYAIGRNIPLVLNTINGMRKVDENIFMYKDIEQADKRVESIINKCNEYIEKAVNYCFQKQLKGHFNYIIRTLRENKLGLSKKTAKIVMIFLKGRKSEILLYSLYKISRNKMSFLLYVSRKIKTKLGLN